MNKGKVELEKYSRCKNSTGHVYEYSVEHNNGNTSVEQKLTIRGVEGLIEPKWIARIEFDEFPPQSTPELAALKLAEWLERMSAAIKTGEYQPFVLENFKDIVDT